MGEGFSFEDGVITSDCIVEEASTFVFKYSHLVSENEFVIDTDYILDEEFDLHKVQIQVTIDGAAIKDYVFQGKLLIVHENLEDANQVHVTITQKEESFM